MFKSTISAVLCLLSINIYSQIQWEPFTEIPGNSDIQALSVGPDGTWYCYGTYDLFSSPDKGETWIHETRHGIQLSYQLRRLEFLDDATPVLASGNRTMTKREGEWITMYYSDFDTFRDTIYAIKSGYVHKSADKGLTWVDHLKLSGKIIHRYRQHHGRHYVEYSMGTDRRFGEVTMDGTILRWRWAQESNFELFEIDDCDNIHYFLNSSHTIVYPDGTWEHESFNFTEFKYLVHNKNAYRYHDFYGYISKTKDCSNDWEHVAYFDGSSDFFPIADDTIMFAFEKSIKTYKLPDTLIGDQPVKNVPFNSSHIQELTDGTRFASINLGSFKIFTDGHYEELAFNLYQTRYGPSEWMYRDLSNTNKAVVSKDAGETWDTIIKPAHLEGLYSNTYPITEDIIAFAGFEGTTISFSDGTYYTLEADQVNDIDHFYTSYRKVGNLILMRENLTVNISGFDLNTREFIPLIYHNTTGLAYSNIDAAGTLYNLEDDNKTLRVAEYPYTEFKSVTLPNEYFRSAIVVDGGIAIVFNQNIYYYDKDLAVSYIPLGNISEEQLNELVLTKSGKWVLATFSKLHPTYISTEVIVEDELGALISGSLTATDNQCEQPSIMSGTNWKFHFKNDEEEFISFGRADGAIGLNLPEGDYEVKVIPPYYSLWEECSWPTQLSIVGTTPITNWDITSELLEVCDAAILSTNAARFRRCFESTAFIQLNNVGARDLVQAKIKLDLPEGVTMVSSSFDYYLENEAVIFPLETIFPGDHVRIPVVLYISCEIDLGQQVCLNTTLEVDAECSAMEYRDDFCLQAIGSWDPNDKHTTDNSGMERSFFEKDDFIYYKINFQNTGTDTAFNIKIVDPLHESLDMLTFEMISSSHDLDFHFDDRDLIVEFDNIQLPDSSTNLMGSNGYFEFRIKMDTAFTSNDTIFNRAGIVFDFNEPIYTNTVSTHLQVETSLSDQGDKKMTFVLNPNPARDHIRIEVKPYRHTITFSIFDLQGNVVLSKKQWSVDNTIDLRHLPAGVYFVKLLDETSNPVQKLLIQ